MVGGDAELARAAGQQRAGDDERDVQRFLVGHVPLLVHPAVCALHVTVIGAEDHDRVLVGLGLAERVEDPRDLQADLGLHLVVELQVGLDRRLRRDDRAPVVDVALLAGGLRREVLFVRRCLIDMRHLRGVVTQPLRERDDAEQRVVVRVQERAHRQPRRVALFSVEALEQRDRLIGGERVLDRAGVALAEPVRLGPHPLGEAVVIKQIGPEVPLDIVLDRRPVVLDRLQTARRHRRHRDAGVKRATCPCRTSDSRRPGTNRPASAPCRRQPEHVVAGGALGAPVVCATPAASGYWPVSSDARLGAHAAAIG